MGSIDCPWELERSLILTVRYRHMSLYVIRMYMPLVGPRTLEGVYPGEIVEVIQILHRDGNTFLRLADDRGWVYEKHFKVLIELSQ